MKRYFGGVAAAFMLFTAGQAAAEGLPPTSRIAAPVPVGPNWNGFYLGVGIGAGSVVHDLSASCTNEYCWGSTTDTLNFNGIGGEGVFGTVTVGYDRVIRPGWVAGVFADYDFGSNISADISISGLGSASLDHN